MHLAGFLSLLSQYKYFVLFPLAAFEGPIVSFVTGFAVSLGYLNPLIAYGMLLLGDLIPDSVYYFIGRYGEKRSLVARYGGKVGITESRFAVIQHLWRVHPWKTMFFSKIAYGLSTIFLISAGLSKMPLRKFYLYAFPITFFQYGALMLLGYYFGNSYSLISAYFKGFEIVIAVVAVILLAGYYFFMRSMRKRFIEKGQAIDGV